MDATIVIPVFNQLRYTRQCLESLSACGYSGAMIVVVNNASTDGTAEFLASRPGLRGKCHLMLVRGSAKIGVPSDVGQVG